MMVAYMIGECTNPFILGRTICERLDIKKGRVLMGAIFMVSFLIVRTVFLIPFTFKLQWDPTAFLTIKITAGSMLLVSLMWVFMILNKGAKELKQVSYYLGLTV